MDDPDHAVGRTSALLPFVADSIRSLTGSCGDLHMVCITWVNVNSGLSPPFKTGDRDTGPYRLNAGRLEQAANQHATAANGSSIAIPATPAVRTAKKPMVSAAAKREQATNVRFAMCGSKRPGNIPIISVPRCTSAGSWGRSLRVPGMTRPENIATWLRTTWSMGRNPSSSNRLHHMSISARLHGVGPNSDGSGCNSSMDQHMVMDPAMTVPSSSSGKGTQVNGPMLVQGSAH